MSKYIRKRPPVRVSHPLWHKKGVKTKQNTNLSSHKQWERLFSNYEAITNLFNETWDALTGLPVNWLPPQKPPQASRRDRTINRCGGCRSNTAQRQQPGTWKPHGRTCSPARPQRMVQKNFFSRNGFSDAGTGTMSGSSRILASQYAIRSAAALDTWGQSWGFRFGIAFEGSLFWVLTRVACIWLKYGLKQLF